MNEIKSMLFIVYRQIRTRVGPLRRHSETQHPALPQLRVPIRLNLNHPQPPSTPQMQYHVENKPKKNTLIKYSPLSPI